MAVLLRRATLEDLTALLEMWLAFLDEQAAMDDRFARSEDASERWRNDFPLWVNAQDRCLLVAFKDAEAVGFLAAQLWASPPIYRQERTAHINEVYVTPSVRGQGVGKRLVSAIRAWSEEVGARRLQLVVLAENEQARAFWTKEEAQPLALTLTLSVDAEPRDEAPSHPLGFH